MIEAMSWSSGTETWTAVDGLSFTVPPVR